MKSINKKALTACALIILVIVILIAGVFIAKNNSNKYDVCTDINIKMEFVSMDSVLTDSEVEDLKEFNSYESFNTHRQKFLVNVTITNNSKYQIIPTKILCNNENLFSTDTFRGDGYVPLESGETCTNTITVYAKEGLSENDIINLLNSQDFKVIIYSNERGNKTYAHIADYSINSGIKTCGNPVLIDNYDDFEDECFNNNINNQWQQR